MAWLLFTISVRKQIKIRPGYTPQEDVSRFRGSRQQQMDRNALPKGHILGWAPPSSEKTAPNKAPSSSLQPTRAGDNGGDKPLSKSAAKNAKRKAKKQAEKEKKISDNWEDSDDESPNKTAKETASKDSSERTDAQMQSNVGQQQIDEMTESFATLKVR